MIRGVPRLDYAEEGRRIANFISRTVGAASAKGAIVALSGGVDSTVVGALCVKALGPEKVLALILPSDHTPKADEQDAEALVESWGIRSVRIPISQIARTVTKRAGVEGTRIAKANVEARARMIIAYYHANTLGYLVAGTGDGSELLMGYYTKWGDGGADFLPIAHLYKTQVRELGAYMRLPRAVVDKPPSPQLWPGHRATDELPADYERLDVVLHQVFDLKAPVAEAARAAGVPVRVVREVVGMNRRTAHKRALPPSLA